MPDWATISNWLFVPVIVFAGWGVRRYLIQKGAWSSLKRCTLAIGLGAWMITEAARSFYRPWIYRSDLSDWHVADTIGNSMGTVTAVFIVVTMAGEGTLRDLRLAGGIAMGILVYELMAGPLGGAIDPWDIAATVLFGTLSVLIYWRLIRREEFGNG